MFSGLDGIPIPDELDNCLVPLSADAENYSYPTSRHVLITLGKKGSSRVMFTTGSLFDKLYDSRYEKFSKHLARICGGVGDVGDVLLQKFSWDLRAHEPQRADKSTTPSIHYFVDEDFDNLKKLDSSLVFSDTAAADESKLFLPSLEEYSRETSLLAQIDALKAKHAAELDEVNAEREKELLDMRTKLASIESSETRLFREIDELRARELEWSTQRQAFMKKVEACELELTSEHNRPCVVTPTVDPVVTPTVDPVVTPTVDPVVTPTVDPVVTPTVDPVVTPTVEEPKDIIEDKKVAATLEKRKSDRKAMEQNFALLGQLSEDDMQFLDTIYGKDTRTTPKLYVSERDRIDQERERLLKEKAELYDKMEEVFTAPPSPPAPESKTTPPAPPSAPEQEPKSTSTTEQITKTPPAPEQKPKSTTEQKPKPPASEQKPKSTTETKTPTTKPAEQKPKSTTSTEQQKPKTPTVNPTADQNPKQKPATNTTTTNTVCSSSFSYELEIEIVVPKGRKRPKKIIQFDADVVQLDPNVVYRQILVNSRNAPARVKAVLIPSISMRATRRTHVPEEKHTGVSARAVFTLDASMCEKWTAEDFNQFSQLLQLNTMAIIISFTRLTTQKVVDAFERIFAVRQNPYVKFPPNSPLPSLQGHFNMFNVNTIFCHGVSLEQALAECAKRPNKAWVDSSFKILNIVPVSPSSGFQDTRWRKVHYAFSKNEEQYKDPKYPGAIGVEALAFGVVRDSLFENRHAATDTEPNYKHTVRYLPENLNDLDERVLVDMFLYYQYCNSYVRNVVLGVSLNNALRKLGVQVYHFFFRNRLHQVVVDGYVYLNSHYDPCTPQRAFGVEYAFFVKALHKLMDHYRHDLFKCTPIDLARFILGDQVYNVARHAYLTSPSYIPEFDWDARATLLTKSHYIWNAQGRKYYMDKQTGDILQRFENSSAGINMTKLFSNPLSSLGTYYSSQTSKSENTDEDVLLLHNSLLVADRSPIKRVPDSHTFQIFLYRDENLKNLLAGKIQNIPDEILANKSLPPFTQKHSHLTYEVDNKPKYVDTRFVTKDPRRGNFAHLKYANAIATLVHHDRDVYNEEVCLGSTNLLTSVSDLLDFDGKCAYPVSFGDNMITVGKHSYFRDSETLLPVEVSERNFSLEIDRELASDANYFNTYKIKSPMVIEKFSKDSVFCRTVQIRPRIKRDQDLAIWFQIPQQQQTADERFTLYVAKFKQPFSEVPHMATKFDMDGVFQQEYFLGRHLTMTCRFKISGEEARYMFVLRSARLDYVGKTAYFSILN